MKKIIIVIIIAIASFMLGAKYTIDNLYIETWEPSDVEGLDIEEANYYYAVYTPFSNSPKIY